MSESVWMDASEELVAEIQQVCETALGALDRLAREGGGDDEAMAIYMGVPELTGLLDRVALAKRTPSRLTGKPLQYMFSPGETGQLHFLIRRIRDALDEMAFLAEEMARGHKPYEDEHLSPAKLLAELERSERMMHSSTDENRQVRRALLERFRLAVTGGKSN
jgi:hypothetical protein